MDNNKLIKKYEDNINTVRTNQRALKSTSAHFVTISFIDDSGQAQQFKASKELVVKAMDHQESQYKITLKHLLNN